MIYHPGHFHGISHEADEEWLIRLPMAAQMVMGDGKSTRFRLKFEARKWASFSLMPVDWAALTAAVGVKRAAQCLQFPRYTMNIGEDSHYIVIRPALEDGQWAMVQYHYVEPL